MTKALPSNFFLTQVLATRISIYMRFAMNTYQGEGDSRGK